MLRLGKGQKVSLHLSFPGTAFLVGSGISLPSGIPSGMAFNSWLASHIASKHKERALIQQLLIINHNTSAVSRLRFEQLIALLRERLDPQLRILNIFGQRVPPTYLHYVCAFAIQSGSPVFTTNFDSLIESAYEHLNSRGCKLNIACFNRRTKYFAKCSFQEACYSTSQNYLYKLHGTMHLTRGAVASEFLSKVAISSINATLDNIGAPSQTLRLEKYKHLVLAQQTLHKTLVIAGYSGLDDFDVIPSLSDALSGLQKIIWISHYGSDRWSVVPPEGVVPDLLLITAKQNKIPIIALRGNTKLIIASMFALPKNLPDVTLPQGGTFIDPNILSDHVGEKAFFIGRILEESGKLKHARHSYYKAATVFMHNGQREDSAAALRLSGKMDYLQGNHRRGLALVRRALRLHESLGSKQQVAADLILKSKILSNTGKYQEALMDSQKATALYKNIRNTRGIVVALMRESEIRRHLGHYGRSVSLTMRALKICRQKRFRTEMGMCFSILTNVYRRLGKERLAFRCAKLAQRFHSMVGNNIGLSNAYRSEAAVHLILGNCAEAEEASRKALDIARTVNKIESVATNLDNLGISYSMQGHYRKALKAFRLALRINSQIDKKEEVARGYENIAICHYHRGELPEAEEWIRKAYKINAKFKIIEGLPRSLITWASILTACADLRKARIIIRRAAKLEHKLTNIFEHARFLNVSGQIASKGINKDRAVSILQSALALSGKHKYAELVAIIAENIAEIYRGAGKEAFAERYLQEAYQAYAHIENHSALRRLKLKSANK